MATSQSQTRDTPGTIEVSIIVVSYNTREMTLECLRSVVAQSPELGFEVLFIDNQSTDGSFEAVQSEFGADDRFQIVASDENLGFARANNVMAKRARGRRLLLLNPDTVVLDRALETLNAFADERSDCGIWGGRTVQGRRRHARPQVLLGGSDAAWGLLQNGRTLEGLLSERILQPTRLRSSGNAIRSATWGYVTGCLLLIDRSLWERLDGFAPRILHVRRGGGAVSTEPNHWGRSRSSRPEAAIIHYVGASATTSWQTKVKVSRGEITLMRLHWSKSAAFLGRELIRAATAYRAIVFWAISKVRPNEGSRNQASDWKNIWGARTEWLPGYDSKD